VFGDYISVYDIQRAVQDGATVPIDYESRLAKLTEHPKIDPEFEEATEGEEVERKERLKSKWAQLEAVVGSKKRLTLIAKDIVEHFEKRFEAINGKAMIVCMSRRICVELYREIVKLRPQWESAEDEGGTIKVVMTGSASDSVEWQPPGPGPTPWVASRGPQANSENTDNTAGWTLAVVYANPTLPIRNMTVFVGAEGGGAAPAQVSGFCTPGTGAVNGRVLVSATEGDSNLGGDEFRFGPTSILGIGNRLSGLNNPLTNFFASQINNDLELLNITGTFGTLNHTPGGNQSGRRQGWDITNVSGSAQLTNNQTQAFAQGTTSGDQYTINGLGLQSTYAPRASR